MVSSLAPTPPTLPNSRLKSSILSTYLDPKIRAVLKIWAAKEGRTMSNLAAFLITNAVNEYLDSQQIGIDEYLESQQKDAGKD